MLTWLLSLRRRWLDRADKGWQLEAHRVGTKPPIGDGYDYELAQAAVKRAQTRSETGRVYRKPTKAKRPAANVVPLRRTR